MFNGSGLKRTPQLPASLVLCALLSLAVIAPVHAAGDPPVQGPSESGAGEEAQDDEVGRKLGSSGISALAKNLIEPVKQELLGIELPDIERRYHIGISMSPKLGDTFQSDYIRSPIKFKYGLAKNIELSVMPVTYIHNPRRKTVGLGIADLDMGIKYRFLHILRRHVSMAFAFHTIYPVGSNPELMDGYVHYRPKLIVSKTLEDYHKLEIVGSVGWDLVDGASEPLVAEEEERKDITGVAFGLRLPRDPFAWSLEFVYTTDKPDNGEYEALTVTPGWHWNIPREQAEWFPGDLGLSLGVGFGFMDAKDVEYITKVRATIPIHVNVDLERGEVEFKSEELRDAFRKINERLKGSKQPEPGR